MTVRYSVACRGASHDKSAQCLLGGGWMSDEPNPPCPHCGKPMFTTATMTVIDLRA